MLAAFAFTLAMAALPVEVHLQLNQDTYAAGDTLQATVTRVAPGEMIFAFYCDATVEAMCDSVWTTVYAADCSRVRVRPAQLAQGASASGSIVLQPAPGGCEPLRVRLRYQVGGGGGYRTVYSTPFKITRR